MAFGYRYWLALLPDIQRSSFLLFVHNPAGSTKLRDYSSGSERVLGQPPVASVFDKTEVGRTRFECDPHPTTDHRFWYGKTLECNQRFLGASGASPELDRVPLVASSRQRQIEGRAIRGSQRQLQDYVNDSSDVLSAAILNCLPVRTRDLGARIRWVSPLASEKYREYRDADFFSRVGLASFNQELAAFWPNGGPCWDALGVISDPAGRMKPGVILVEAKSHISEIYGSGCQASSLSRSKIEAALEETKRWCGISPESNWLGPLYQSANRIAHLYFLRQRLRTPTWLVNLYFINDPIAPTDHEAWHHAVADVKMQLGIRETVPSMIEVFLPAHSVDETRNGAPTVVIRTPEIGPPQSVATPDSGFARWVHRWTELATFTGSNLPEPDRRIQQVLALWDDPIPGTWERGIDPQLNKGSRYRRGDFANPHPGEHTIEHEILCAHFSSIYFRGRRLTDGLNAMPLVRDARGGRRSNVEADLFLLTENAGHYQLVLCEVKDAANTPWYAVIENLRQLRLLHSSSAARQLFHLRNPSLSLSADIAYSGLVIAPAQYYMQRGQRANVVPHVRALLKSFVTKTGIDVSLATWDVSTKRIESPWLR